MEKMRGATQATVLTKGPLRAAPGRRAAHGCLRCQSAMSAALPSPTRRTWVRPRPPASTRR
eukprot:4640656-Lingulodinium_polyedra.AAC.1